MFGRAESPGNIKNQVGRSLNSIREAVEKEDVLAVARHFAFLVAIAAPKLTPGERERFTIPEVEPGKDKDGRKADALFVGVMTLLADLLCILSERGLYSWQEREAGDASGLALTDDEGEEAGA